MYILLLVLSVHYKYQYMFYKHIHEDLISGKTDIWQYKAHNNPLNTDEAPNVKSTI